MPQKLTIPLFPAKKYLLPRPLWKWAWLNVVRILPFCLYLSLSTWRNTAQAIAVLRSTELHKVKGELEIHLKRVQRLAECLTLWYIILWDPRYCEDIVNTLLYLLWAGEDGEKSKEEKTKNGWSWAEETVQGKIFMVCDENDGMAHLHQVDL